LKNIGKRGGSFGRDPFQVRMKELIHDWDMLDIKPTKGKYIWSNIKRFGSGHIAARLDHFLVHSNLLTHG
jgi:hypothetical protein